MKWVTFECLKNGPGESALRVTGLGSMPSPSICHTDMQTSARCSATAW